MKLSNKYNIPQETVDKMVQDGVIPCQWPRWEKIYEDYKKRMEQPGAIKTRVILDVASQERISERHIREIISKFK